MISGCETASTRKSKSLTDDSVDKSSEFATALLRTNRLIFKKIVTKEKRRCNVENVRKKQELEKLRREELAKCEQKVQVLKTRSI
mmetsp:Transcript_25951/g.61074  ORF Transcript_25951/g.61074 Transcript_25951/m.61074 type:complete len:85 (-) Transcript_25951:309-563(-)